MIYCTQLGSKGLPHCSHSEASEAKSLISTRQSARNIKLQRALVYRKDSLGRLCSAQHNPTLWHYRTVVNADIINQAGPESAWIAVPTGTKIKTCI
jgi:hypothetical protein